MRLLWMTLAMLLGMGASACPSPDGPVGERGGAGSVSTYRKSACGMCVEGACSPQIDSCAADPECAVFLSCLYACPPGSEGDAEPSCETACPQPSSPAGTNALAALTSCRISGAGAECAACGHPPTGHPLLEQQCAASTAPDACDKCEEERCCETRCEASCQSYIGCMQGCGGQPPCEDACAAEQPAGVEAFGRWLGCQVPLCREHCGALVPGPCLECGLVHCPDQFAACFASPSCYLRFYCGTRCDTAACYGQCDAQFPEASALFGAFLLCVGEHCVGGACDNADEF